MTNAHRPPSPSPTWLPEWNGALYAANTQHHRRYDAWFLENTPLAPSFRVLDLGCGSGDFTRVLAGLVPQGHVVGLDPQASLLEEARRVALPNQTFVKSAAQDLATSGAGEGFDLVMSRAAFHWIPGRDHPALLGQIKRHLKPGGWFRLEMGGAGNIPNVVPLLDEVSRAHGGPTSPWFFPDAGAYLDLLENAGFDASQGHVRTVAQRREFDVDTVRGWFESQALQAYEHDLPVNERPRFHAAVLARLGDLGRSNGSYDLTYVRLEALVRA